MNNAGIVRQNKHTISIQIVSNLQPLEFFQWFFSSPSFEERGVDQRSWWGSRFFASQKNDRKREEDLKKILICLLCMFICVLGKAATETINWYVDGNTYATTTCQTGGDITLPTAPTKYGYTFQGWAGYVFLEYIESTGTQYIDSDYTFTTNSGVLDIDFVKITPNSIPKQGWGSYTPSSEARCLGIWFDDPNHYAQIGGNNLQFPSQIAINERHHLIISAISGQAVVTLDGTEVINSTYTNSIANTKKWFLFSMNNNGTSYQPVAMKVYNAKLYEDGILVRNFIPAKNSANVAGMYDTVSRQFFTNEGTGEFIAGPVINQ